MAEGEITYVDVWLKRVDMISKLVANIGFPMVVASGLLYVILETLPVLVSLNLTLKEVSGSINSQQVVEQRIVDVLSNHNENVAKSDQEILNELQLEERKMDQYHQDYMLSHHAPVPMTGGR